MARCRGSLKFTLNGDKIGAAKCSICGRKVLLHIKFVFKSNRNRTAGYLPAHDERG